MDLHLKQILPNYRRGIKRRGSASRLCRMSKLTDEARGCDYEIRILGICTADPEPDGLHPSDAGCIVMATKIQASLESISQGIGAGMIPGYLSILKFLVCYFIYFF